MDIGSGLGVDSFIAASAAGATGSVTGVDISAGEVKHANRRAVERCAANVAFVRADAERLPFPDASFDRVVSNGAFCLVPDKGTAFREVLRVLRPGGRFSVACTSLLDEGIDVQDVRLVVFFDVATTPGCAPSCLRGLLAALSFLCLLIYLLIYLVFLDSPF